MLHQFTQVDFTHFKAFKRFTLKLKNFNILVGPNNSGKSTILAAFRILAAAMRRASARKATLVRGPNGMVAGYEIDLSKGKTSAKGINDPSELSHVFNVIGSNLNPILTQLAKTRRVLFVEGKDFQILGRFARKLGATGVGNRRDFAVVPIEGFNPERIKHLKAGMEATLGAKIHAAAILDRDLEAPKSVATLKTNAEISAILSLSIGAKRSKVLFWYPKPLIARSLTDWLNKRSAQAAT
ncbi:AAA family ATPase [Rhizobium ruizarguesonis]|uniref:AAA family ATPase n=1 Tax=Rhizobium ruizarguesonis TaxID=2081791 RepID=UPI00102F7A65|nr:AAA family ATPase [Rhizobium ruizarguesonis]TBD19680.1 hypothetical protein ELH23_01360 [Rhizobium ruizarguesonis]